MIRPGQVGAVARYSMVEMSRRRLLAVLVAIALVLIVLIGIAPLFLGSILRGPQERTLFFFSLTDSVIGTFALICALGIGATVLYHDLDSGSAVSIFAKPVSRLSYTLGKFAAAVAALAAVLATMEVASYLLLLLNGGSHQLAAVAFYLTEFTNLIIVVAVVMIFSALINNIVAAVIGFVVLQAIHAIELLHNLAIAHLITNETFDAVSNVAYWLVPHELQTDFNDPIVATATGRGGLTPSMFYSGWGDLVFWAAYLVLLVGVMYLAVRRRQV